MLSIRAVQVLTLGLVVGWWMNEGVLEGSPVLVDFGELNLAAESVYQMGLGESGVIAVGGITLPHTTPVWGGFSEFTVSNLTDTATAGFANAGSAIAGGGHDGSHYAVGYVSGSLEVGFAVPGGVAPQSLRITNTTYGALSMRDGDGFAKKFGGADGTEADWFRVTVAGLDGDGSAQGSVDFYLADFRFADDNMDYIVDTWELLDLSPLGTGVVSLSFSLASSDNGSFGMNTPSYLALDSIIYTAVPEPKTAVALAGMLGLLFAARRHRTGRTPRRH